MPKRAQDTHGAIGAQRSSRGGGGADTFEFQVLCCYGVMIRRHPSVMSWIAPRHLAFLMCFFAAAAIQLWDESKIITP